ncbi:MAG TPA: ribbon-helix-helix protein, CopG family [Candidatus Limnocylindria bacterium]|nr:ribbon-helix-helix protein, CopG family [Candidatus Limnocylindria bacterium]
MRKRRAGSDVEQLSVGFEGLEVVEAPEQEPRPDTMRQIVSLRMPDALMQRVEAVARARGVSPSSLMRALIAAGLDRSYAAVQEDVTTEIAALRRQVAEIAERLGVSAGKEAADPEAGGR